jgi:hypothetical protein
MVDGGWWVVEEKTSRRLFTIHHPPPTIHHGEEGIMGTWGEQNFDNDGARDYLSMLTAKLVATITEIVADEERLALDEDGETMLMPSVEVLALLCERYNAVPPKLATVRCWEKKYLQMFDREIDTLHPRGDYKTARRKVIENTFRWLEGLAESYWEK